MAYLENYSPDWIGLDGTQRTVSGLAMALNFYRTCRHPDGRKRLVRHSCLASLARAVPMLLLH